MTSNKSELNHVGYQVVDSFLTEEQCQDLLRKIDAYREHNGLLEIHRPVKGGRALRYRVISGDQIEHDLRDIWELYTGEVNRLVNETLGFELAPLENTRAGVNVNLMRPKQSSYRWHYDRARVTSILYLNEVEGGETELYPNYRILLRKGKYAAIQRGLDRLIRIKPVMKTFGNLVQILPKAGRLIMMRADRAWHSVRSVSGDRERINIIFSYDYPGTPFPMEEELDSYLYTHREQSSSDPNYG